MSGSVEEPVSDEEIFFGKLTLKEFKKHILWNKNSPALNILENRKKETHNKSLNFNELCNDYSQNDNSINILESHSEPDLRPGKPSYVSPENCIKETDDSFLQLEGMVNKLCEPSTKNEILDLNNTLDVIDFILKNGPNKEVGIDKKVPEQHIKCESEIKKEDVILKEKVVKTNSPEKKTKINAPKKLNPINNFTPTLKTPKVISQNCVFTPLSTKKTKEVFKTPAPMTQKKLMTPASKHKSPGRIKAFQHVGSPVSAYIRNHPQEALIKDVHPKKPLFGCSSIPKLSKEVVGKSKVIVNKENNLPSIAYKSAKTTKIINTPDQVKLPKCQWIKKITSTLPRPVVLKHERREVDFSKSLQPEESCVGLPFTQAEVSVCTKKPAYRIN